MPDYVTRVKEGGFYGWPWFYIGRHPDPRHAGEQPELETSVLVPDVLLQSHSASLEMCFYTGGQFPAEYAWRCLRGGARLVEPREEDRLQGDPRASRTASPRASTKIS